MKAAADISYWALAAGYSVLLIPFFVIHYFKTGLLRESLIAVIRMSLQLFFIALYLEYMFRLNNIWLNIIWVLLMILIAAFTVIRRSGLNYRFYLWPVFVAGLLSIAVTDAFFLGGILNLPNAFEAQYFIPITGMLIGNTIRTVIIGMNDYHGNLKEKKNLYRWYLANGATRNEALLSFRKHALQTAFNPMIATMAVVGLISLPGMMTGQILGGNSPTVAVKYQIMLLIVIFSSEVMSMILTVLISDKYAFDSYGNLKI